MRWSILARFLLPGQIPVPAERLVTRNKKLIVGLHWASRMFYFWALLDTSSKLEVAENKADFIGRPPNKAF